MSRTLRRTALPCLVLAAAALFPSMSAEGFWQNALQAPATGPTSLKPGDLYQGQLRGGGISLGAGRGSAAAAAGHALSEESRQWRQVLLAVYCVLVVAGSLIGGWLPSLVELTHTRMQTLVSLVGGLMLGIGLFHLLPHAVHELGSVDRSVRWMMFGILSMFLLIRVFHVHHHGPVEMPNDGGTAVGDSYQFGPAPARTTHDHDHTHDHQHAHAHNHGQHTHRLSWIGIALGLALHTLIDGIALGAHVAADSGHEIVWSLYGLGTFLGVLLHKPLDAVSITSLMAAGGWSPRARNLVNVCFALMCPLGAVLFVLGIEQFAGHQHQIVGCALAFAAGVFLCISLGDLLPEMEFHSHNRLELSLMLILGIVVAWAITFLEPAHMHVG